MSLSKERGKLKLSGLYTRFIIKCLDTYLSFSIKRERFQENYTSTVFKKNGLMQLLLQNGKNPDSRDFAVCSAYKRVTLILERVAFAVSQKII